METISTERIERLAGTTDLAVTSTPALWECDVCGSFMLDLHCKLKCAMCGFMRDCSDP